MKRFSARALLRPGALLVIVSNALPIVGVLAWGWDVFLVLLVYWFETVIVAFWTVARIACLSSEEVSALESNGQRRRAVPLALFFTAHSGLFIGVHFMFLWALFAGEWPHRIGSLPEFFRVLVVGTGLWIPLAVLFATHGLGFVKQVTGRSVMGELSRVLWGAVGTAKPEPVGAGVLARLYGRIIVMQFAIILGGMLAAALGSMAPLLILIAIKTAIETTVTVSSPAG